jgi:hypothetical protein
MPITWYGNAIFVKTSFAMISHEEYNYDSVYPYKTILQEVRSLILPTIIEMSNPEDPDNIGMSKDEFADVLYTHIMALGYNAGDVKAAFDDIFPARNRVFYPDISELEAAARMIFNLMAITKDFKHQVWAFRGFHQDTEALKPHDEVIREVKKQLLAIQYDRNS